MQRLTGILLTTAAMGTVVAGATPLAGAVTAGGANNVVLVNNTVDGATASRSHLAVAYDPADTVANQNIASATGNDCNGCRTVAVAMQLVVVEGSPSTFVPANAAVAANGSCTNCQTFSFAYQYVVQPGRVVYLGATAQQQLLTLRQQADAIASSNESYDDMKVELDTVFGQFVQVVNDNMQAAGASSNGTTYTASNLAS